MIERPFDSILDRDLDGLYQFVSQTKAKEWGLSESGRTPAQLAYHTGSGILTAIIVAASPSCIDEIPWSYPELVEELVGEYSAVSYCAGWYIGIEYILWSIINKEYVFQSSDRLDCLSPGVKNSIKKVASLAGAWVVYDDTMEEPESIELRHWENRYLAWKATRAT